MGAQESSSQGDELHLRDDPDEAELLQPIFDGRVATDPQHPQSPDHPASASGDSARARPITTGRASHTAPDIGGTEAPVHNTRHGQRPQVPEIEHLKSVLSKLLNCPQKEKAVLGFRKSLISRNEAGDAISEIDIDVISACEGLTKKDLPVVHYILRARGAFTSSGALSLRSTLEAVGLRYSWWGKDVDNACQESP